MTEDRRMERLRWRCRRGLLELDLLLKNFLEQRYADLTPTEQAAFEKLLNCPDEMLQAYLQGGQISPDKELMQIISKILE